MTLAAPGDLRSQAAADPWVTGSDVVVGGVALGLYVAPVVLGFEAGPPDCLPCDRATLPFFDRWSVGEYRSAYSALSSGLILGLAAGATLDLMQRGPAGFSHVIAWTESAALATGITTILKDAVARHRPILYTDGATELRDPEAQTRSWPSGHTAAAFAIAASYVLSRPEQDDRIRRILAVGAAVAVGALRVASARHFLSDVVSGAAVGVGSAVLVHRVRF